MPLPDRERSLLASAGTVLASQEVERSGFTVSVRWIDTHFRHQRLHKSRCCTLS